jgi:hypothetical protein
MLIEEGSGEGVPDSLPKVEVQMAPLPRRADVSSVGRTIKEIAREEPPPCEVMAVAQEEASVVGGEAAGTVSAKLVSQMVPAPLALTGVANPSHGGRASPSLAQTGVDLPTRGGTQESRDPAAVILTLGDEVEDAEWRSISGALSAIPNMLRDVVVPSCQV